MSNDDKIIEMIEKNDIQGFVSYVNEHPTEVSTFDYQRDRDDDDDDDDNIDFIRLACFHNRVEMVKHLINTLDPTKIKSDYQRIAETVCRKKTIDVLRYFIKEISENNNHPLFVYMGSDTGLCYHGYNIALFYLEKDVVKLLKETFSNKCRMYTYKNYPFYVQKKEMLELHSL
jgi:hypothetical protein